jgi:uncharacterized membrane protein
MNEANTSQYQQFVWRRLSEPIELFGRDWPPALWLVVLGLVLATAFTYVVFMYIRDSRGIGGIWATFLALLRSAVYALLAVVFLMPALQTWEETKQQSKVIVLLDPSNSMTQVIDDVPTGAPGEKLRTRQDKVLDLLTGDGQKFLSTLEAKNPLTIYRFARRIDENYLLARNGQGWTRAEWEESGRNPEHGAGQPPGPLSPEYLRAWLNPYSKPEVKKPAEGAEGAEAEEPDGAKSDRERLEKLLSTNEKLLQVGYFNGTNVGDSVKAIVDRELNNMVQGIVVFTDGRSTEGSPQAFRDLEARAKAAHIPIFVVVVGEERPQVRIDIVDLRVPEQIQPEDKFRAVVEVTGEGLAEKPVDVALEITHTRRGPDGKEEKLPIAVVEPEDKKDLKKTRDAISLGDKLTLKQRVQFDRSMPPRVTVEYQLDAATLAAAAGVDLGSKDYAGKKWELAETKDGELNFRAVVARDKGEVFTQPQHVSEKAILRVIKKPLRVLLFASAPTRDYQFLRTFLVREMEKMRGEVAIHLQLPPGVRERRTGVVQDVPPERLLSSFPTRLEAAEKEDKLYALDEYDVIVAFDPDWTQLTDQQLKMVRTWVDKGGGLVVLGGPINTLQLARPGDNREKLKPILELYPVVLRDIRIEDVERTTSEPWPLNMDGATPDMEFLKLAEADREGKEPRFLEDWNTFFYGPRKEAGTREQVERGFYSYYPIEKVKPGALVVARFTDPKGKMPDGSQQPYLVLSAQGSGRRVVWIGSGETWRLRQYKAAYHERFWTKLLHFAGAGNMGKVNKRIRLDMGSTFTANQFVQVEAKIDGKGGEAYPPDARPPEIKLTLPAGSGEKDQTFLMKPKPRSEGIYSARFQVRVPGEYNLHLEVPDTKDAQSKRFSVKEANPELDNTRPDFEQMYQLASEADEVLARMGDAERQELKRRLHRPKLASDSKNEPRDEKVRLFFDLSNAYLIPTCMTTEESIQRSRGPIQDQWDSGVPLWMVLLGASCVFALVSVIVLCVLMVQMARGEAVRGLVLGAASTGILALICVMAGLFTRQVNPYFPMSIVLGVIVTLLSLEWLTRKLLRLA